MIEGVQIVPKKRIVDERGFLSEILRSDDPHFKQFGQVYIAACFPGVVKAWHAHEKQTDNFFVVRGTAKVGLYDSREDSPTYKQTQTVVMGELNPVLLVIPPMVWHGQMALGDEISILINVPTELYDYAEPDELRADPFDNDFGYEWEVKSG